MELSVKMTGSRNSTGNLDRIAVFSQADCGGVRVVRARGDQPRYPGVTCRQGHLSRSLERKRKVRGFEGFATQSDGQDVSFSIGKNIRKFAVQFLAGVDPDGAG